MFYFYIVRCKDNSLYCGQTSNLERRIAEHNSGSIRGARYTRSRSPVVLVYSETYSILQEALRREYEVKQWRKKRKEDLVNREVLEYSG